MVAEVSGHNAEFIMKKMPYARGLQFRTVWWQLFGARGLGIETEPITGIVSQQIVIQ